MTPLDLYGLSRYGAKLGPDECFKAVLERVRGWCDAVRGVVPIRVRVSGPMRAGGVGFAPFMVWYRSVVCARGGKNECLCGVPSLCGVTSLCGMASLCGMTSLRGVTSLSGAASPSGVTNLGGEVDASVDILMQRRYLGYLEWMLHEVQDFIDIACGDDDKGRVSEKKKLWIATIMAESTPIVHQYAAVSKSSALGRMLNYASGPPGVEAVRSKNVVYARWNLVNDVSYVGETGAWDARVAQHYMQTRKHASGKCGGCAEHAKYLKHRPVTAARWMMTPIRVCASKGEAELLERKIERVVDPTLNRMVRKFPSEQNYTILERKLNHDRRAREKARADVAWSTLRTPGGPHDLSRFWVHEGVEYLSLENLLASLPPGALGGFPIKYHLGRTTVGSWRRVKAMYGDTVVTTDDGDEMSLREWCGTCAAFEGTGEMRVTRIARSTPETEKNFIRRHQIEDGLRKMRDGELLHLWHDRKTLPQPERGVMIRKIWDEHEIRFPGLTRRPIEIKIPFVHGLDTRMMKAEIMKVITKVGAEWPVYIKEWHQQHLKVTTTARPTIGEVLTNVNLPHSFGDTCVCQEVEERLRSKGWSDGLPKVRGHIFLIGREYRGPCCEALGNHACNIPKPTGWDVKRVWGQVREQLPDVFKTVVAEAEWMGVFGFMPDRCTERRMVPGEHRRCLHAAEDHERFSLWAYG